MTPTNDPLFPDFVYQGYTFSANKDKLQCDVIHRFLEQESYWAAHIPFDKVMQSIEHAICIGIYTPEGHQAGFGRMITDRATFGYLADIFVLEAYRGRGLSKEMMRVFCSLADTFGLRRFMLATRDAHDLYRQYGFETDPRPERLMSRPGIIYQP